jgi:hypothetical protein
MPPKARCSSAMAAWLESYASKTYNWGKKPVLPTQRGSASRLANQPLNANASLRENCTRVCLGHLQLPTQGPGPDERDRE